MQVMSDSVSKALRLLGGTATEETAKFVEMFDKFFDALNVSKFTNGKQNRKPFQSPYRSGSGYRLKVVYILPSTLTRSLCYFTSG